MKSIESNFKQMISPIWVDPTIQVNLQFFFNSIQTYIRYTYGSYDMDIQYVTYIYILKMYKSLIHYYIKCFSYLIV